MKRRYISEATEYWEAGRPALAGRAMYEHIRREHRPLWAAQILRVYAPIGRDIPEIAELLTVATDQENWSAARGIFERLRRHALALHVNAPVPRAALLRLAEDVAKVIYNATSGPAPYDHNSGWRIAVDLRDLMQTVPDEGLRARAWRAFTCEDFAGEP